jgi:hypothetical protein
MKIILILFLFFISPQASALNLHYWASPTGTATTCAAAQSPTRPTTNAGAMASIRKLQSCLTPGDTMTMMKGTYMGAEAAIDNRLNPALASGTQTNPIIIEGEGAIGCAFTRACQTILKPSSYSNTLYDMSWIIFRRFEVDGSVSQVYGGQCFYIGNQTPYATHDLVFEDIHCHHAPGTGFAVHGKNPSTSSPRWPDSGGGDRLRFSRVRAEFNALTIGPTSCGSTDCAQEHGFYAGMNDSIIEDSIINDNGKKPPSPGGYGHGLQIYDSNQGGWSANRNIIRRNIIVGNAASGIAHDGAGSFIYGNVVAKNLAAGIGVGYNCPANTKIFNNTVVQNGSDGMQIGISATCASTNRIENNIVMENNAGSTNSSYQIVYYNNFGNSGNTATNLTSGNLYTYTVSSSDYHLKSGSLAIDKGVLYTEVKSDIDGVSRPQNGVLDIGAYEFLSGTQVPVSISPPENLTVQ